MRVLHVTPYFAPAFGFGGPPRSILSLCKALTTAGIETEVYTTTADVGGELPAHPDGTTYDGVRVRYFPVTPPRLLLRSSSLERALQRDAGRWDVVHAHGLFNATSWAAARAARRHAKPLVVSVRGMLEPAALRHHAWRKRAAWMLFDRRTVDAAAWLHCTSDAECASVGRLAQGRILHIANPVDASPLAVSADAAAAFRERHALPQGAPLVTFIGRLHPIKRLDLLARAFALVAGAHSDAHLVIAGDGDAAVRASLPALAGSGAARVRFTGPLDSHQRDVLLSTATVLVLCSDSENFGMSVAEALTAGVPVVATHSVPWSVIAQANAGRWVPQTVEAIAAALDGMLADREGAAAMGLRGRQLAADRFSPAGVAAQWRQAYAALRAA